MLLIAVEIEVNVSHSFTVQQGVAGVAFYVFICRKFPIEPLSLSK